MTGRVELVAQLNPSWRIVVATLNRYQSWALERLEGDVWTFQTATSGAMLRWLTPTWCGPIDGVAAAILAQLPKRPAPLERLRRRACAPSESHGTTGSHDRPGSAGTADRAGAPASRPFDGDVIAQYWRFHHGVTVSREPVA
jgi:hypothetical protein